MNPPAARMRVVAYARVSTEKQAEEGVSLDAQAIKLRAYCTASDLDLVSIEVDEGVSAKTLNRPALQRALAMLREGKADAILVAKLDRLTRSVRDLGTLIEEYFAHGRWCLLSMGDSIDTRSAAGRLVLNMMASVAQWEREAIVERTIDALGHLKRKGVRLGGASLGWRRSQELDSEKRRVFERVDEEVRAIERIRELRTLGLSFRSIAAKLHEEGLQPKKGGKWHANTIRRVVNGA